VLTEIQGAVEEAVHPQPAGALTAAVADPPAAPNDVAPAVALSAHSRPACEIVMTEPATVNTPLRASVEVFGVMV
jgi:hypothetical protein